MLRVTERVYLAYFLYVTLIAGVLAPQAAGYAAIIVALAAALMYGLARISQRRPAFDFIRDWLPIVYTLVAYREMNWFTPEVRDYHLEKSWIVWDRVLLNDWGLRPAIESLGALLPGYLEFCYLLVYIVSTTSIGFFYFYERRERIDAFSTVYAAGTLLSYGLFPFFPSDPPRVVFAGADQPGIETLLREFNLYLVGSYGIHSSVFPSAHVSSAFGAGWGLLTFLPEKPWIGRGMLIYAVSVSIATIYGRYHYATDALAGAVVGLMALAVALGTKKRLTTYSEVNDR